MAVSKDRRNDGQSNQLLGALETASRKRIDPHLEPIKVGLGDIVCEAGGLLKHAYFPEGAVLSLLTALENGSAIETANVGREGAFGLFAAMYSRVSFNRCLIQLVGDMVRCPIELLQSEFKRSEHVRDLFVSYSEFDAQIAPCTASRALSAVYATEKYRGLAGRPPQHSSLMIRRCGSVRPGSVTGQELPIAKIFAEIRLR
jgi:hypothetical protein